MAIGIQIEHQAAAQVGEVLQSAGLREKRRLIALGRRPAVFDALVRHDPRDVNAPVLLRLRLIAQALERNAHFDFVAALGDAALRLEDEVGAEIGRLAAAGRPRRAARAFGERAIELDAERVDAEHQRLAAVVVGAQKDDDVIVGLDAIAIGERRAHGAGRRRGANAEVHRGRRIPHEHVGRVVGGRAVDRRVARKPGEHRRLRPHRFVEIAVDLDRLIDARRFDIERAAAPVIGPSRGAGRRHRRLRDRRRRDQQAPSRAIAVS